MYISSLMVNVGDNPDRPRPGRKWLRNRYRVHQRLCMAFPSDDRAEDDRSFLKPFKPDDFAQKQIHVERNKEKGFLYRIDPLGGNRVIILVLSAMKPDWDYAFQNAEYLIKAASKPIPFEFYPETETRWKFLIEANPVKRVSRHSTFPNGDPIDEKWIGKRVPVPADQFKQWFEQRAKKSGFEIEVIESITAGYAFFNKTGQKGMGQKLRSVRFQGVLRVTDPVHLRQTLCSGFGPAKAFGFGLMSVARM